ncbi:MAG: putative ankyrin repeat domain-containing protein 55 [Harvfovirus sp.]|uniref:Putative ankyrin repeat domain-containing protein 55 n=1 Tax=Harvfovirus sp. TaxID=2487768 RepID=A0A3G5A4M8_9VIRU|nr:MAG: putative ankyrin repeat domain-containing protein 55 [Harvfovirus sp.]
MAAAAAANEKVMYRSMARDRATKVAFLKIADCFANIDIMAKHKHHRSKVRIRSRLQLAVTMGGDLNLENSEGRTLLLHAVKTWQAEYVEQLCEFKVNLNCKDLNGNSALLLAIDKIKFDIALCLIKNGADVNSQSRNGETPLMRCVTHGNVSIFDKLMEREDIKLDLQNAQGLTALHLVIVHCRRHPNGSHFLERLIERKASMTILDNEKKPPLVKCIEGKNVSALDILMGKMAKTEREAQFHEMTYLAYSVAIGEIDVAIGMIKNHPIDVNAKFGPWENVFPLAVDSNSLPLVKKLVDAGCSFRVCQIRTYALERAFAKGPDPKYDVNITKYIIDKYLELGDMSFMLENHSGNKCSDDVVEFCKKHPDTQMKIRQVYKRDFMLMTDDDHHLMKQFLKLGGRDLIDLFIEYL